MAGALDVCRRRRWAPGPQAKIDWSHPLARGLVAGIAGSVGLNGTGPVRLMPLSTWTSPLGRCVNSLDINSGGASVAIQPPSLSDFTFTAVGYIATVHAYGTVACIPYRTDGTWTTPYNAVKFGVNNTNASLEWATSSSAGTAATVAGTPSFFVVGDGKMHVWSGRKSGSAVTFWRDGALHYSTTGAGSVSVAAGSTEFNVYQRSSVTNSESCTGWLATAFLHGRALSDAEIASNHAALAADPFCFLRTRG